MKNVILFTSIFLSSTVTSYSQHNNIAKKDKFSMATTIAGYRSGDSISIDELRQSPKLIPDRDAFEILSFTWGASCLGGTYRAFDVVGDNFREEDIALVGKVYFLFVDNIKAKNKVGQIVYLKTFNIKIVDKK